MNIFYQSALSALLLLGLTGLASAQSAQESIDKARELVSQEKVLDAMVLFAAALEKDPELVARQAPEALRYVFALGTSMNEKKDYKQARYWLNLVARGNPTDAQVQRELGYSCYHLQAGEEAARAFREASRLAPGDAEAWAGLGEVLFDLQRDDTGAGEAFDRAIACGTLKPGVFFKRALIWNNAQEYARALPFWERAVQLDPETAAGWQHRGDSLLGSGRAEDAILSYSRAAQLDASFSAPHYSLGLVYAVLGRVREYQSELDILRKMDPAMARRLEEESSKP